MSSNNDTNAAGDVTHRGIPVMEVVEDVESFLAKQKMSIEEAVRRMEEEYRKYKYVESTMQQQKARLLEKLPEFENSLAILDVLMEKKEKGESFETTYLMAEELYAKAVVPQPEKVAIWLGANVMVEYELDKAKTLLTKNHTTISDNIKELTTQLAFIKDQITTTEVNMAHVYNFGVKKRQGQAASS